MHCKRRASSKLKYEWYLAKLRARFFRPFWQPGGSRRPAGSQRSIVSSKHEIMTQSTKRPDLRLTARSAYRLVFLCYLRFATVISFKPQARMILLMRCWLVVFLIPSIAAAEWKVTDRQESKAGSAQ